jgi:hypothetical protein
MPFGSLLLLPLLGGFIFTRYWNKTRYESLRAESERLLLLSSVWGFITLSVAFIVTSLIRLKFPVLAVWWYDHLHMPYSGTACLSFLLGALSWIPLNYFFPKEQEVGRLIEENGDRFELLLKKAMEEEKMVSVTLKNGKVYAGFVRTSLNPANRIRSMGIIPTRSGYRNAETRSLIFNFEYASVFDQLVKEYDDLEAELVLRKRDIDRRVAHRNTKATEMQRVADEARPDMIIDPNASRVMGELNTIDEEIGDIQREIEALEERLDKIADGLDDYETIIPVDEVSILSIYNHDFYQRYFATQQAERSDVSPGTPKEAIHLLDKGEKHKI